MMMALSCKRSLFGSSAPKLFLKPQALGSINRCICPRQARAMAHSKFEYVKQYEQDSPLLLGCWIVVRVDGKGFTKFCDLHGFDKPNDKRALDLMDASAVETMKEFADVVIAYGDSDEYSFVFHKDTQLYGRRNSKLVSLVSSCFTANYVRLWPHHFQDSALRQSPIFDARAVCYPSIRELRDYLSWRQADAHVNNQYNTCFWALVKSGLSPSQAHSQLKGTDAAAKNELLFSRFSINYNDIPEQFRKGSVIICNKEIVVAKYKPDGTAVLRPRKKHDILYCDIISDDFWTRHPDLLSD